MELRYSSTCFVLLLTITCMGFTCEGAVLLSIDESNVGPCIDRIEFQYIPSLDQRILSIQAGEIDLDLTSNDLRYHIPVVIDPNLLHVDVPYNQYYKIDINCSRYPLNYTALRRAFALSYDKYLGVHDALAENAKVHDSVVPWGSTWCIEEDLTPHYYDAEPDAGNLLLDGAGFAINASTGYRCTPSGDAFEIPVYYNYRGGEFYEHMAIVAADALQALHIDATPHAVSFNPYDYDYVSVWKMIVVPWGGLNEMNDLTWFADRYWSMSSSDINPCCFNNDTFDAWREQLLEGTSYEDVFEAAAEMQRVIHENVPTLIVGQFFLTQMYRNDQYAGFQDDIRQGVAGQWTMRRIHRLDGSRGGIVRASTDSTIDSLNLFTEDSDLERFCFDHIYSSLFRLGLDQQPVMDLAATMLTETHQDNSAVQDGNIRFTLDIIHNATWSDGVPLTAYDVAYTFAYIIESGYYGNPAADDFSDLVGVYAPNPYRVVIEFDGESYWHFDSFAYTYIIPRHIFNDIIGPEGWETWNPVYDPEAPHVTCGPFVFDPMYFDLQSNPDYHYAAPEACSPCTFYEELSYIEGTAGNTYTFAAAVQDSGTYRMEFFSNHTVFAEGNWSGTGFTILIDGLAPGFHRFRLYITYSDGCGCYAELQIEVIARTDARVVVPTLLNLIAAGVSGVSLVVILGVTVAYFRKKRAMMSNHETQSAPIEGILP